MMSNKEWEKENNYRDIDISMECRYCKHCDMLCEPITNKYYKKCKLKPNQCCLDIGITTCDKFEKK
jgi:hypothetical protein